MSYRIKITYQTGNSFISHNVYEYLDLSWKNLDVAKENLKRIKEHYDMYCIVDGYVTPKGKIHLFKMNEDKDWFVNIPTLTKEEEYRPDFHYATYCLFIKADNGNKMQMSAFWCGYFEKLIEIEIVLSNDLLITSKII
jgi:hypothetical protein